VRNTLAVDAGHTNPELWPSVMSLKPFPADASEYKNGLRKPAEWGMES
jgi:hypothetical protein